MSSRCFLLFFAGLLLYSLAWPTTTFSQEKDPQRQALLKQRDDLANKANDLNKQGKSAESLAAFDRVVELERKLFGPTSAEVADRLAEIASIRNTIEDFVNARKAGEEVLAIRTQLFGPDHWQMTDARLALAHTELQAKLSKEQRQELQKAELFGIRAYTLFGEKKYDEAMILTQKMIAIEKKHLGEQHFYYANSLVLMADLYEAQRDYA